MKAAPPSETERQATQQIPKGDESQPMIKEAAMGLFNIQPDLPLIECDRALTPEERDAVLALAKGEIEPLADLFALQRDQLHPVIQRMLWHLIRGKEFTDYRLKIDRHPEKHHKQTIKFWQEQQGREQEIAMKMWQNGALDKGGYAAAVIATRAEIMGAIPGKSEETIERHIEQVWMRQKSYIEWMVELGFLMK